MKEYTPKDVIGMMRTYSDDIKMRDRLKREYEEERNASSVSAAQYGIESVMPHGNGVSNPTQKQLNNYFTIWRIRARTSED